MFRSLWVKIRSHVKRFWTNSLKTRLFRLLLCWWRKSLRSTRINAKWKYQHTEFKSLILSIQVRRSEEFDDVSLSWQMMWLRFWQIIMKFRFWMDRFTWSCWLSCRITFLRLKNLKSEFTNDKSKMIKRLTIILLESIRQNRILFDQCEAKWIYIFSENLDKGNECLMLKISEVWVHSCSKKMILTIIGKNIGRCHHKNLQTNFKAKGYQAQIDYHFWID